MAFSVDPFGWRLLLVAKSSLGESRVSHSSGFLHLREQFYLFGQMDEMGKDEMGRDEMAGARFINRQIAINISHQIMILYH